MQALVIAVISIVATLAGALIGGIVPSILKKFTDRRACRVKPSISIWCNMRDDIDERLKNQNTRWFLDMNNLSSYRDKCFYLVISSENEYRMLGCNILVSINTVNSKDEKNKKDRIYKTSLIDSKYRSVIPILYADNEESVECNIEYFTEHKEKMLYQISFTINPSDVSITNRKDKTSLILKEKNNSDGTKDYKLKQIDLMDVEESECFSSNEIVARLGDNDSLNYYALGVNNHGNSN